MGRLTLLGAGAAVTGGGGAPTIVSNLVEPAALSTTHYPLPSGAQVGDLLLLFSGGTSNMGTVTLDGSGATLTDTSKVTGTTYSIFMYQRVLISADLSPFTVNLPSNGGFPYAVAILIRGAGTTATWSGTGYGNGSSTTAVLPNFSPSVGSLGVLDFTLLTGAGTGGGAISAPAGGWSMISGLNPAGPAFFGYAMGVIFSGYSGPAGNTTFGPWANSYELNSQFIELT